MKKEKEPPIKYKGKSIKMHEDTWKLLKEERIKSGLSWNTFLLKLLGKEKVYAKKPVHNSSQIKNKDI